VGKIFFAFGALVCALQAQPTVTLTTSPSTLTFTYQSGATTLPKAQKVSVTASSPNEAFTTATPSTDYWLSVSMDSGTLPASLSVEVNPNSLAVGSYQSSVTVTVSGVTPAVIVVNLDVTEAPSTLSLSPTTLTVTAPGGPQPAQTVTLTTDGAPISYSATSGVTWATVTPAIGIVFPGQQVMLSVTIDSTSLVPSATPYVGKITVVASGAVVTAKSQSITMSVTVQSVTPTITSIWPLQLPVNGGAQILTIRGTGFYSASMAGVQIGTNVTTLATTVVSPSALLAVVPAPLLTTAGSLAIVITNPAPGGASGAAGEPVVSAPTIAGIFSAASYASATVSPGELITIFGTNIGPATPATMNITGNSYIYGPGYANTSLSNVTLTIDGQNAPLLYVSADQVSAQVPYEVTVGASVVVTLTNGGVPVTTSVTTAANAPGIFTANGSGTGQAAAINTSATTQAVTLNSTTSPANIGDTVSFYLTGEGSYFTSLLTGATTTNTGFLIPDTYTPLPTMPTTPTVQIGGVDATAGVSYAGVVPGSITGVLQINVVVPTGSSTGASVPVAISIGGNSTQSGITINVHP
jgi:uncharacterized protein (TIGR03437 family)